MSEVMKDSSEIKLFGKTIFVSPEHLQSYSAVSISSLYSKDESSEAFTCTKHKDNSISLTKETLREATTSSGIGSNHTEQGLENGSLSSEKEEPSESSASQEKTLKTPDKILHCPRCNSMDTKFCYYNNYNVNQPRHFCKKCQRYWTAGGTMRNVAVGSGRRKNKNPNYGHIMVSDADVINGIRFSSLKQNGFVIFGADGSMDPERSRNCTPNDFREHSSGSSIQKSSSTEKGCNTDTEESGFQNPWTASGIPVMFYQPTTCWNGSWVPPSTSPTSCTLGKHSREGIN